MNANNIRKIEESRARLLKRSERDLENAQNEVLIAKLNRRFEDLTNRIDELQRLYSIEVERSKRRKA